MRQLSGVQKMSANTEWKWEALNPQCFGGFIFVCPVHEL